MLNDVATTDVVLRDGSTVCIRQVAVEDVDPLQELDLNPVMVTAPGACVADARVRIEYPRPQARNRRVAY